MIRETGHLPAVIRRVARTPNPTHRLESSPMPYTCHDCGDTFDAPTDTETVACPGCGGPAFQEAGADPDLAESLAADVHYLLGYIGPHPHADGSTGCEHCARVAVARANVRTADERPTQPATPADTHAADRLVADAHRAVHESLTFLAAPEADRVRALIADLETAVEGRTAIRFTAAATVPASAPADQAALAARPQTLAAIARHLEARAVTILRPDSETYAEYHAVAAELRRLADAASGPGRADDKTQRPRCPHCQMPHDLTPDVAAVCASIRASVAADEAQQDGPRKACACGQDGCEYCDVDDDEDEDEAKELPGPEVVAYSNSDRPGVLLCREHGDGWWGLTPLTSDDLPDGGVCTFGDPAAPNDRCGRDVLIATGETEA